MSTRIDVACLGEVIVDFIADRSGSSLRDVRKFQKHAGGAAANVAVGLARLGSRVAFVGRVGHDSFGSFLKAELLRNGVDTRGVTFDPVYKTRLAFVSLTRGGERDFEFWEQYPADEQLRARDLNGTILRKARIVHVSSFLLLKEPVRSVALKTAGELSKRGCIISFDPNIRASLWPSARKAQTVLGKMIRVATVLRMNMKEAAFLTEARTPSAAERKLRDRGPSLVVITLGKKGCFFGSAGGSGFVPGFRVKTIDTTGCGDGFLAGLLNGISRTRKNLNELTVEEMREICRRANAVGALTATKYGVFPALPGRVTVERFLARHRNR